MSNLSDRGSVVAGSSGRTSSDWDRNLPGKLEVFVDTWKGFKGTESAGAQQFIERLLQIYEATFQPGTIFEQHPLRLPSRKPSHRQASLFATDAKPQFTTERMDMYLPKVCVWEMKAPAEKDLQRHHGQILCYWARVRTRYMVLCNFHEFWIYDTDEVNGQLNPKLKFPLSELPARRDSLFFLRGETADLEQRSERVTAEVAGMLGGLVRELLAESSEPDRDRDRVTKFVLECVFAMFAEDTELVSPRLFTDVMREADQSGKMDAVWSLFDDFGRKETRDQANRFAPYVNGLFFDRDHPKIPLKRAQIHEIYSAVKDFDWQDVRPEIFGSIFERALDLVQRHELGAHFTREADIFRVVGPTVIDPWRQRIKSIRSAKDAERVVQQMKAFHVLDPACGCGNFLYVVYREMKRLEAALADKWIRIHRATAKRMKDVRPPPPRPYFTLDQIHGIEKNDFGAFLTRVVLWIGEHLAVRELGLDEPTLPLKPLDDLIRHADALLIDWPRPQGELAIVGNPPYLGVRKMRRELGDAYVDEIFARYPDNRAADYVTYWFTRALDVLRPGERAGYVCTNSIAQNESREVSIDRIVAKGGIMTDAWRSYPWPGEAAVHIGIVNWIMDAYDGVKMLDGKEVMSISPSLTPDMDVTKACPIIANADICFMGVTPGNHEFVLTAQEREAILANDRVSKDVIRPFLVGRDVNREVDQHPTRYIIDFGTMTREQAEVYRGAFRHVQRHVYPSRHAESDRKTDAEKDRWWQFTRPREEMRDAIRDLEYILVISCVGPNLIVSRQNAGIVFDHQLMVVALSDDYHFGVLQSRLHEVWARARGSTLEERLRYTNTTIFMTFPFPRHPDGRYDLRSRPEGVKADRVAAAAKEFNHLRSTLCKQRGLGLTKIHNELKKGKPPKLVTAYAALNDAVADCYGFSTDVWKDDNEILKQLLQLNQQIVRPTMLASQ